MKRKTCASVLALILTCAMVTGSLPVEANAAEAAAASELTAVQDESQEQAEVTDETKEAGDETAGEQEQVTEPGQKEEKQEEQTTEPAQGEEEQKEQTTEPGQGKEKQEEQTTEPGQEEVKQEEQTAESGQEEQITETVDDQAAFDDQAAPIAVQARNTQYLDSVAIYATLYSNGTLADEMELEKCDENEYNLYTYDIQTASPFLVTALSDEAPDDTVVTAKWTQMITGKEQTPTLTPGTAKQLNCITKSATTTGQDVTVTASSADEGESQTVTIHVLRKPCLQTLSIANKSGEAIEIDNGFKWNANTSYIKTWQNMTATTKADTAVFTAAQHTDITDQTYQILYNGNADQNEIPLSIGENAVTITVVNKEGITNTYKVTITREEDAGTGNVSFETDPEDALVVVKDKNGDRVWPDHDKTWTLQIGDTYSYVVTKNGYIGQKNNFVAAAGIAEITLQKAKNNKDIDKKIFYIKNSYINEIIDKELRGLDYTKDNMLSDILEVLERSINISDVGVIELAKICKDIFDKYTPNYDIRINNLFLLDSDESKEHFIVISYDNSFYSYNYNKQCFIKMSYDVITKNIKDNKIGIYKGEDFYCKESRLVL